MNDTLKISNIVSTFNTGCKLDVRTISRTGNNVEYSPMRFAAVTMRIRKPFTTALIFCTGKVVVVGAKDEASARIACRRFARIIQKMGYPASMCNFSIQNIVGSFDYCSPLRLEQLEVQLGSRCTYEPEIFPGLTFRFPDNRIAINIFKSGKCVITGSDNMESVVKARLHILPLLQHARRFFR